MSILSLEVDDMEKDHSGYKVNSEDISYSEATIHLIKVAIPS
jgi:hypothetical protein